MLNAAPSGEAGVDVRAVISTLGRGELVSVFNEAVIDLAGDAERVGDSVVVDFREKNESRPPVDARF